MCIHSTYQKGKSLYDTLNQYLTFPENKSEIGEFVSSVTDPFEDGTSTDDVAVDLSGWPEVDFAELSEINPEIVGWIYIEGIDINYPITQGSDNNYYLNRLFDGTYNASGCIFLDYRSSSDFSDCHSIIYGHHMNDKSMFGDLMQYKKQTFYDEHSVARLLTPDAYYKVQFFSGYVSDNWSNAWNLDFDEPEFISWLNDIQSKSCFETFSSPSEKDRIITLSTCTYEYNSAKFLLHGFITETIKIIPLDG